MLNNIEPTEQTAIDNAHWRVSKFRALVEYRLGLFNENESNLAHTRTVYSDLIQSFCPLRFLQPFDVHGVEVIYSGNGLRVLLDCLANSRYHPALRIYSNELKSALESGGGDPLSLSELRERYIPLFLREQLPSLNNEALTSENFGYPSDTYYLGQALILSIAEKPLELEI